MIKNKTFWRDSDNLNQINGVPHSVFWFINYIQVNIIKLNCRYCIESIEEADCKRTTTGWEYSGQIGITKSGRTCQAWGSQTPHAHTYGTNLPENYCRDPSDSGYLWCYTTDPYKEWEECNIPNCGMFKILGNQLSFVISIYIYI